MRILKYVRQKIQETLDGAATTLVEQREAYNWCFEGDPDQLETRLAIYDEVNRIIRGTNYRR